MPILDGLRRLLGSAERFDPGQFDDPIARQTKWSPLKPGGASFGTHRLVELEVEQLALKKSVGSYLMGFLFGGVGVVSLVAGLVLFKWAPLLFGILFAGVGVFIVWPSTLIFDGGTRQATIGTRVLQFGSIHAIQILRERVSGNKSSFNSYEFNLIFSDGERLNVVDHGDLPLLRQHAKRIAALIGCPVWDATLG